MPYIKTGARMLASMMSAIFVFFLVFMISPYRMISDKNSNRIKNCVFFFILGIPFPYLFAEEVIQKPWDDNGSIVHLWSSFLFVWSLILFVLKSGNEKNLLKSFRMSEVLKLVSEERNNSLKYETIINLAS